MPAVDLANTNWRLVSYLDGALLQPPPVDAEVTLTFEDGAAGGKSACNRYRSAVTIGDDTLTFGMAIGTRMACSPPLMEVEARYLRTLESVARWQLIDGKLELRDSTGQTLLIFSQS